MALRPFVTAGVAFAAAGVMAYMPAIVPQLTQREEKVAANVALSADLADLINVYFGDEPTLITPDSPGTARLSGVIYQLLLDQFGGYPPNKQTLDSFFQQGADKVVYDYLLSGTTNPDTANYLRIFFNQGTPDNPGLRGASGVIYQRLLESELTPEQKGVLTDFFEGGLTQVTHTQLRDRFQDPVQRQFLDDFYTGGATRLAYRQLGGDFTDPNTSSTPYLSAFFNINNPYGDENAAGMNTGISSDPSLHGVSGVVYQRIVEANNSGDLSDEQFDVLDAFFHGGASQVVQEQLLARTADPNQQNIINEFFGNGFFGVVRYLLTGPVPPAEEPAETTQQAPDTTALVAMSRLAAPEQSATPQAGDVAASTPEPAAAESTPVVSSRTAKLAVPAPEPAKAPQVQPAVAAPVVEVAKESAPEVQPAAAPAPVSTPAADPAPAADPDPAPVKSTSSVKEKSGATDATEAMKGGNKVEVDPIILPGGKSGSGGGSWGIFGQIADAIGKGISGAGAASPNGPAKSPSGSTSESSGGSEG